LKTALQQTMTSSGLEWPTDWEKTWNRIKQVWASKWNDRAFLSRTRMGIPHESLFMAVLIQQVVPADYAFVIHTLNPSSGNESELFAEVVLGLGETLVGNYPGRALSFVWDKTAQKSTVLSFPSKSIGLYGSGLIFRSDSNGEDLEGYAGAGLYDSVLLDKPREAALDYAQERLIWDQPFREDLAGKIARIGLEVERVCGSPQDAEGAVAGGKFYVVQTRPQVGLSGTIPVR
jgi:alpha-glucan,water dikinase